ncbi:MAG: flotillin family protein [Deltaproteobacteria bacterium]|nr:flotillin family protein [Deltaproteobacteria bacterium]
MQARMRIFVVFGTFLTVAFAASEAAAESAVEAFNLSALFIPVIVLVCVLATIIAIAIFLRNYVKVPPNQVAVISGRKRSLADGSAVGFRLVSGGATFRWPFLEIAHYMNLEVISIPVSTKNVITKEGVPLNVDAIANVKIGGDESSMGNAAERFLGMQADEMRHIVENTLEGHLRAICCTLTIEQINSDRQKFAQQMITEAADDLRRMGIVIDALVVQHIQDEQGYLESLGKKRTAEVKRDAEIGQAEAGRDAAIRTAEAQRDATKKGTDAQREGAVTRNKNLEEIAQAERNLKVKQAQLQSEIAAEEAVRDQAGPKSKAESEKAVLVAQVDAQKAKIEAEITLQQKLAERTQQELQATVIRQAEAGRQKALIDAEAYQTATVVRAQGDRDAAITKAEAGKEVAVREGQGEASKIKQIGEAEAARTRAVMLAQAEGESAQIRQKGEAEGAAIRAKLLAEAEGTLKKAEAMRQMEEAAKLMFILDRLPTVIDSAGEAAAKALTPAFQAVGSGMASIDKVTIIETGDGSGQGGVARFASTAPTVFFQVLQQARALGLDPTTLFDKLGVKVVENLGVEQAVKSAIPTVRETAAPPAKKA